EVLRGTPDRGRVKFFGKESAKNVPTVLVMGGSQGAQAINNVVISAAPELVETCRLIHITGRVEFQRINSRAKAIGLEPQWYAAAPFLSASELGLAYAVSDVVVSRAGANTI